MSNARILIVATSADTMTNGEPTGIWLEELTTPYYTFVDAGANVSVSSIAGGAIPVDQRSIAPKGENDASVERYFSDLDAQGMVKNSTPVVDFLNQVERFDAVFLPGGHGTMFDYPKSADLAALIEGFDRSGKVVAAVCHGPAGLTAAKTPDGSPLVSGRTVAAFTDSEEHAVGLQDTVPFLLESRLRTLGAKVSAAPDFQAHAVRDGRLVTGQNPASAARSAVLVMDILAENIPA